MGIAFLLLLLCAVVLAAATDPLLNEYPFVMTHDAASGEIIPERDGVVVDWAKTQGSGLVAQLDCGARAFDYRPYCKDGMIYAHHGGITIKKPMKESLVEIKAWAATHRGELVLIYLSHFDGDDSCNTQVENLLTSMNVHSINDCSALDTLTYSQVLKESADTAGGHVLAVFDCMNEFYDSGINCYEPDVVCYDKNKDVAWGKLESYLVGVTKQKPVKDGLLWMAQAHWQSTAYSISAGTLHRSSLLIDEEKSQVNTWLTAQITSDAFSVLNMVEVDNICDHGQDLLSAVNGYKQRRGYVPAAGNGTLAIGH